ncbi:2-methylisocitrate lyase-like PEP mutase family enzyme [Streptosporangium becharense]|uniref:2-methylisocitrate lyase-like PEP mutase family enzyme n=1 Tax=Streptosporangium becharense TaxID=1816182 RepID=A0A7W9IM85_9ACTN|nr:isocitrate lyase/phosphoenolpyruvate mutase family protein [Streptosporangium becharense]MBB2910534.1 2-methylisocitrate lyase-like PEP mutase family enzyme [Streptosporangium becharense]MBB5823277.1 2-methylisocitrate lyase-like PEP mutase family enzyme [Streptosporangium becharense]
MSVPTTAERFAALHRPGRPLLLPNAWDHASAVALARAGFAAVGTTSLGVAAAAGLPDAACATREQTLALARSLTGLDVPVTVDIEGGFGGTPAQVTELVAELAGAGVAGVNLEDGRGTGLAAVAAQAELIGEIKTRVPGVFLNARTDAFWLGVPEARAEALARVRAYAGAGADGVFVPGAADGGDVEPLVCAAGVPLNVLVQPGVPVERLAAMGVARISFGSLLFRAALHAAVTTALEVSRGLPPACGIPSYEAVQALHRHG